MGVGRGRVSRDVRLRGIWGEGEGELVGMW